MSEANTAKGKILVADDSPTILGILQAMLEGEGYEVIPATDGVEAISKAYQDIPDLVVLDIFMPKINGYQVCRLLKYDELTSHIPIIMLTGSERGDRFWSLETGADEFRTKDFEFQGLIDSIESLLKPTTKERTAQFSFRIPGLSKEAESPSSPGDEIQILSKLGYLLDRELYKSTIEKIRLETILNSLGEGVFTIDADKRIIAFNRSLCQMTGLSQEQVLGEKCSDFIEIPLCSRSCLFDSAMSQLAGGNSGTQADAIENRKSRIKNFLIPVSAETEITGQEGRKIPINLYVTLLEDHVGKIVGAVCVCRDITRMKEIERMNDELSKAYKDLQDAQAQLIQSEKMASLGRLVPGAAHELNNPISFIYSNISHLRKYIDDMKTVIDKYHELTAFAPEQRAKSGEPLPFDAISGRRVRGKEGSRVAECEGEEGPPVRRDSQSTKRHDSQSTKALSSRLLALEKFEEQIGLDYTMQDLDRLVDDIDEGARRTKDIVEDLKAFSRPDKGKIQDIDVNEDIEKSLSLLIDYYKDRITIHKDYADLPRVKCYAGQIGQIFMNLITNACQAIEGQGDIWITTQLEGDQQAGSGEPLPFDAIAKEQKPKMRVVISIKDNGVGIAQEHIDKIFDPFFTTKDASGNTGLGLSTSYGIVQRHRGEISVDSSSESSSGSSGSGTIFTVRIPVDFEQYQP